MQLAPADQHGAYLSELAALAAKAVGLGVDDQELGSGKRCAGVHDGTTNCLTATRRLACRLAQKTGLHDSSDRAPGYSRHTMTTYAPNLEAELREREREAWQRYSSSLRALEGRDYEDAETEAWAELQRDLRAIDAARVTS